jgi:beta-glucanase (GH16 family)
MTSQSFARAAASSNNRTKLFLGSVCAVLLATATAEAKPYKGAEVYSRNTYKYGRMEMRMRMIRGSSLLSTFFTYKNGSELASTPWEEIDLEVFGQNDAKMWQSNIITNFPKDNSQDFHKTDVSLADDYHTYTVEWAPDYVLWMVDGQEVLKTEGGPTKDLTNPHSLRFNAWSSETASWAGEFDESVLPAYQFVSWFKYYRYENGKFVLDWADDFKKFDETRWAKANWSFGGNRVDFDVTNAVVKDGTLVLAITKEGETGFTGSVPADPQGQIDDFTAPKSTGTGTSTGTEKSTGTGTSASTSSSTGSSYKDTEASPSCNYAGPGQQVREGWIASILMGLALLGLRTRRSRRG